MKKIGMMILALAILLCGCGANPASTVNHDVLRLHVIANSDSEEDQDAKLYVRDKVLAYMDEYELNDKESAMAFAQENTQQFELIAQNALAEKGLDYGVKAEIGVFDFPARDYGGESYPAGKYDALKIELGEAKGQNWWCVMFPPLCLTDISYAEKMDEQNHLMGIEDTTVEVEYESIFAKWWNDIFGSGK